jgi:hypothetical protein
MVVAVSLYELVRPVLIITKVTYIQVASYYLQVGHDHFIPHVTIYDHPNILFDCKLILQLKHHRNAATVRIKNVWRITFYG